MKQTKIHIALLFAALLLLAGCAKEEPAAKTDPKTKGRISITVPKMGAPAGKSRATIDRSADEGIVVTYQQPEEGLATRAGELDPEDENAIRDFGWATVYYKGDPYDDIENLQLKTRYNYYDNFGDPLLTMMGMSLYELDIEDIYPSYDGYKWDFFELDNPRFGSIHANIGNRSADYKPNPTVEDMEELMLTPNPYDYSTKNIDADGYLPMACYRFEQAGPTTIALILERMAAKMDVTVTLDDEFKDRFKLNSIQLKNIAKYSSAVFSPIWNRSPMPQDGDVEGWLDASYYKDYELVTTLGEDVANGTGRYVWYTPTNFNQNYTASGYGDDVDATMGNPEKKTLARAAGVLHYLPTHIVIKGEYDIADYPVETRGGTDPGGGPVQPPVDPNDEVEPIWEPFTLTICPGTDEAYNYGIYPNTWYRINIKLIRLKRDDERVTDINWPIVP